MIISQQLRRKAWIPPGQTFSLRRRNHPHLPIALFLLWAVMKMIQILLDISALHNHLRALFPAGLVYCKRVSLLGQELRRPLADGWVVGEAGQDFADDGGVFKGHSGAVPLACAINKAGDIPRCEIRQGRMHCVADHDP